MLPATALFNSPILRQAILSICISMSFFCIGLVRGYSAPAVPSIMENDPDLLPTKNIASWASSIPPAGAFCGSIVAGPLLHYIGRKYTIVLSSPLAMIGWCLIAMATRFEVVIAGRFLTGFCVGLCLPSAQIYIGECCDSSIRGVLGSLPTIFMSVGILIAYIIGSLTKWDNLAWFCSSMAILCGFLMLFMVDSPVWLRSRNQFRAAEKSIEWLKLPAQQASSISMSATNQAKQVESNIHQPTMKFFSRPVLMPLAIGLTLLVLQQISGIDAIIFFTVEIFRASGSSINEHLATIMVGLVQLLSNIAALFIVDKSGRKPLLIISAVIMSLSMASMGTAFYLKQQNIESFGLLPLISLVVFMIGFSIGFGCIPYLLLGELFPAEKRSTLGSIAGSFNLGVMFIVIKTYHYLETIITTAGTFWMYAVFCACAVFFVIGLVPETKGRDLDEIAMLFAKNRRDSKLSVKINTMNGKTNENPTAHRNAVVDKNQSTAHANGIADNDSEITKL